MIETVITNAQMPEDGKKRRPVSVATAEESKNMDAPSSEKSLRDEIDRLKKIIEYGPGKAEADTSPYDQVQLGEAEEVRLVEERRKVLEEEDVDRIREIDGRLDAMRHGTLTGRMARPQRTPIANRDPLKFGKRKGYRRRVVNDIKDGARIRMFLEAGWRFVDGEETTSADGEAGRASQIGSAVRRSVGAGVHAYLMEIPKELYERDQKMKSDRVDQLEKGMIDESAKKVEGQYGSITINR